ncbi:MAG: DNA repair protein RecN [Neisseriaceae bacterium]|nr:DNA repair protein RecN [Neisseriaceae bacterium]
MLLNLSLKNFVIVDELQLSFDGGFTVLTGETGAGKSIILDAIGLLLGDKADFSQIRNGQKEAKLSALFAIDNLAEVQNLLIEQGLSEEPENELVISRIISEQGRSRQFINGQAATVAQLKQIGEKLIDIHGQHAHYSLMNENEQRHILDSFSGCLKQAEAVKTAFQNYQDALQALTDAQNNAERMAEQQERLQWQWQELSELAPKSGEWEELSAQYDILSHAADIQTAANNGYQLIDGDNGMASLLHRCVRQIEDLANIEPNFNNSLQILASVEAEIGEVSSILRSVANKGELDPQELAECEERMHDLAAAAKKYRCDEKLLPEKLAEIEQKLHHLNASVDIESLQKTVEKTLAEYQNSADNLSQMRQKGAVKLSQEVEKTLHELAMNNAVFQAALLPEKEPSAHGNEKVQYQIDTTMSGVLRPLAKTASGGELARISLAVQVAAGQSATVPTLIFDEVDSGIGGRVADIVGQCIKKLSQNYQILAITHLAQVAAYANFHWQVVKNQQNEQIISKINYLDEQQRIDETARMIGGQKITATTRNNAAEMLKNAHKT